MGKDYCAVPGCHNTVGEIGRFGKVVKLHRLPRERSMRAAWIRAISRKNYTPTRYTQVCSDHFPDGEGRTWKHNVPTLNLKQKKDKVVVERRTINSSGRNFAHDNYQQGQGDSTPVKCNIDLEPLSDIGNVATQFHSYALAGAPDEKDSDYGHFQNDMCMSTGCQVSLITVDVGIQSVRPEIIIEDIKYSDELILFYTGIQNFKTFNALFNSLIEHGADRLNIDDQCVGETKSNRTLRLVDEFLMVVMRLRLGLLLTDLQFRFKLSAARISRIFSVWIKFMHSCMEELIFMPKLDILQANIPECFKNFKDTRVILDCTEMFVQAPSSLTNKSHTYSHYKSHNTFKALVGISMTGAVVFLSKLWGGSASDVLITRESGLYDLLEPGDAIMVDKGFINIASDLKQKNVKLYCPPMLSCKTQFSKSEVELTRRVASARIHVERKMEQIKNFRILQGELPLSLSKQADSIFFVCCALTNLLRPLVTK